MAKTGRPAPGLDDYLYWQELLANREASDLGVNDFCAVEGVSRSSHYRWVERLKDGIPDAVKEEQQLTLADIAEPKFLPVSITSSPVEIELPNGGLVRLPVGVDSRHSRAKTPCHRSTRQGSPSWRHLFVR